MDLQQYGTWRREKSQAPNHSTSTKPRGLQTKVFIIERAALCCCGIFKHFCSCKVLKRSLGFKVVFSALKGWVWWNQCDQDCSCLRLWLGMVGWGSVRRVMEQQQSPGCCCVLVPQHTMGCSEGPLCLHEERSSAWIRMHPKITWFSTVFARCCYSTSSGGGGRITPSLCYTWKRIKLWVV